MSARRQVEHLLEFIDVSPSPWHAVASVETQLLSFQFVKLDEADKWQLKPAGRYYVVRDDSSVIAFVLGQKPLLETGFKIIGAHTDSPGLRIKPKPAIGMDALLRLGVEVYGGPILATFTDRDLSLAGRVVYKNEQGHIVSKLISFDQPLLRLPNLAIHMNRAVNEEGLKLHKQFELPLILSQLSEQQLPQDYFLALLQQQIGVEATRLLSWELNVYDTQKGTLWGAEQEFYADSQLDNLASCHAALQALIDDSVLSAEATVVCGLFDHEEIGSESNKGADGSFLPDVLQRIAWTQQIQGEDLVRSYAKSFMISADMAHAYQPNFPNAYDSEHKVRVNEGPVIKVNVNQRYSSESVSAAQFAGWCEQAGVPYQTYSHRCDLACGSTIGPMVSARLGIRSVDVGSPLWAMHSIRESAGMYDHAYLISVLKTFFVS
ncbi:MAG: M18 family aminopeptidase [Methylococcaceae bacterium]|nr:M18 family aminopeptidase [Methylococcaceae bacterium]MDP3904616.1 M18 family aminopeptidase [Methylococcaceae bacterium]